ncbi:acyl carrier protein [Spirillospora sp. NPDC048911]|uniref:acyl carrier protein n=1 Tax=Spirillospora sp. NPDC048911 TaxID=3364527 RepID=UPI00371E383D
MASSEFTIKDLRHILHEAAGESDGAGVEAGTMDVDFVQLGYDSVALLETGNWIERRFGILLDEETLFDSVTPRALIEAVNAQLTVNGNL